MNAPSAAPHVVLYGKPGCHLCEQAEAILARLRRRHPHTLEVVDISRDGELLGRYGLRIPVLLVAGREYDAPLDAVAIERALENLRRSSPATTTSGPAIENHRASPSALATEPADDDRRRGPGPTQLEHALLDPQHHQTTEATKHGA